jgi:hypothetical protein
MIRPLLVAALIVATLALAKERHWFDRAGVVGSCEVIAGPWGDTGEWWSCHEGFLTGFPRLERDNCEFKGAFVGEEVWRCVVPLKHSPGPL